MHRITLFNEIAVSLYLLVMLMLTEPLPLSAAMKEQLGWALALIIATVVSVNLAKVLATFILATMLKVRLWYRGIKPLEVDEVVKLRPLAGIRRMSTGVSMIGESPKVEIEEPRAENNPELEMKPDRMEMMRDIQRRMMTF